MSKAHAIIIGAGPGIGLGVATAFGREGFQLSLLSRNPDGLREPLSALIRQGISAQSIATDAADHGSLTDGIQKANSTFGDPEVLIFNVAAFSQGRPSTIDPQQLSRDFHVNVSSALAAARVVLPSMLRRKAGTILFTGGGWALYPSVDYASVSISKLALRSLAFLLAEELKGTGVRAGTVTVMGTVQPATAFDPERIGQAFVDLYRRPTDSFPVELQFKGA